MHQVTSKAWHPTYLNPLVYSIFTVTFLLIGLSFQILLYVSNHNFGLATSITRLHYAWTYGPTLLLTVLASFWARVDYQIKSTAPWSQMTKGPALSQHSVLLDYVSQSHPTSIYTATRNKHYNVAISSLISLTLRITLVISTSLIILSPTDVPNKIVDMTITTQFVDQFDDRLSSAEPLAFAALSESISHNLTLPDGVWGSYAYQTIDIRSHNVSYLKATVDAFSADLECEPASASPTHPQPKQVINRQDFRLRSSAYDMIVNCEYNFESPAWENGTILHSVCIGPGVYSKSIAGENSSVADMGIVISTTRLHSVSVNGSDGVIGNFDILQENSFICEAKYGIKPVHLIRDKTHTSLSPIPNATTRYLHSLKASDLLDYILEPNFVGSSQPTWVSGVPLYSDPYTAFLYTLANFTQEDFSFPSSFDSLYSGDSFPQLVRSSFQEYAPILFLFAVSDPTSIPSSVLATVTEDRLVVQIIPTQVAAILMFTSVLFTTAIWFLDTRLSLPQNPNEMMGTAAVFAHNLMSLAGQGDACFDDLKMTLSPWTYHVRLQGNSSVEMVEIELNQSRIIHQSPSENGDKMRRVKSTNFRPLSLSTTPRLLASTFLSAIIIILEITLRNSQRDRGLGDAASHQNEIQFWAILPGFLSTLANTYCESMDFNTRIQSPLLRLVRGLTFQDQLNLDLLDCHTSLLLYREIRTRSFEASTSTAAVIITSFLMISSASLLFTATIPSVANVQLQAKNPIYYYSPWWSSGQTDLDTATLTLLENISYPTLTYQDLVFPEIILERSLQSGASLQVATPAIHFDFTECRHYNATDINVTVTYPSSSVVEFAVQSEMGCTEPEGFSDLSTADKKNAYLGVTLSGCSRQLWVWGFWADPGGAADSLFGLGCNSTWKTVDTVATFDSQTMTVDIDKPPKVDFSTGVDLGSFVYMNGSDPYDDYYPVGSGSLSTDTTNWTAQDTFFNLLLHSRYALPLTYLRNPDNVTAVAESILFHYKILLGQNLNANGRFAGPPTGPEDVGYRLFPGLNETIALNATARDPIALNRIMQDPASTRILQALLGITLVCIATNWYLMHNAIALPRSPTTIGNWMALLADGNLNDYLPANAAHMPLKDLSRWYFGQNAKFYFGYRESPSTGQQVLGIYVVKNEDVTDEGTFHSALEAHDEQASREFCRDVWRSSL